MAYLARQEKMEDLKFQINYRSTLLDKSNQESINAFNDLVKTYQELRYSRGRDPKFEKKAQDIFKQWKKPNGPSRPTRATK